MRAPFPHRKRVEAGAESSSIATPTRLRPPHFRSSLPYSAPVPYYEYVDGKSSKFWEIAKSGTKVTTRYGRIGSDGQTTTKDYGSAAEAKAAYDKLIEQKTGKGYAAAKKSGAKKTTKKAAKKTAKKAAKKPAVGSDSVLDGSIRYELSDGKSNKFWEVLVDGAQVIVCYGRIGTDGTTKGKKHKDANAARAEAGKLRAEKEAKGYQRVGPGTAKAARNEPLEAKIDADADHADAYLVYGDWLQAQGDPRGELIAIQHALSSKPPAARRKKLEAAEKDLLTRYDVHFVPEPLASQMASHEKLRPPKKRNWALRRWERGQSRITWRYGFIDTAFVSHYHPDEDPYHIPEALAGILRHPSGRFLRELTIGPLNVYDTYDYGEVAKILSSVDMPALRKLYLADYSRDESELSWGDLGDLSKMWRRMPNLEELKIRCGKMKMGKPTLPKLRRLEIQTGGLSRASIEAVTKGTWPALERLELWFGDSDYGGEGKVSQLQRLLDGTGFPKLRYLGLMNAQFTDEICQAIARSKIVKQLAVLDLSMGLMSNDGAAALADRAKALAHLEQLDVSDNYLDDSAKKLLAPFGKRLTFGHQKDPDRYGDGEEYRYVSAAE